MEKSSQIAWKIVPLRHFFPLKVVPLIEVFLYQDLPGAEHRTGVGAGIYFSADCSDVSLSQAQVSGTNGCFIEMASGKAIFLSPRGQSCQRRK
jgi:hypothetical protein